MLINFFQIIFFNQYIVSPKTYIHKISNKLKVFFVLIYLFLVPYIQYKYIILSIIINIIIVINLPIPIKYIINLSQTLFTLLLCFLNFYAYINNTNIIIKENSCQNILINKDYKTIKLHFISKEYNYTNKIPTHILRGILIYFIYTGLLKITYLTTKYENIVQYLTLIYERNTSQTHNFYIKFVTILGYQFILSLADSINTTTKAVILRGFIDNYTIYYYIFEYLFKVTCCNIKKISSTLYYREIYSYSFDQYNKNDIIYEK